MRVVKNSLALVLVGALLTPAFARGQATSGNDRNVFSRADLIGIPVTGTARGQTFQGTLDIVGFRVDRGRAVAVGIVNGTLGSQVISQQVVTVPIQRVADGTSGGGVTASSTTEVCPILNLELGPIFLDLLGLQVIVPDPIVLIIQAVAAPGNLLGNLLCAILGIFDQNGSSALQNLITLLNGLLGALPLTA